MDRIFNHLESCCDSLLGWTLGNPHILALALEFYWSRKRDSSSKGIERRKGKSAEDMRAEILVSQLLSRDGRLSDQQHDDFMEKYRALSHRKRETVKGLAFASHFLGSLRSR